MKGFGLAHIKREGETTPFDKAHPGKRRGPGTTYMELPLRHGMTRKQVHDHVETWLEEHGWTTKPTKNPHI